MKHSNSLIELLQLRARNKPLQHIYTFLQDGNIAKAQNINNQQLDSQARTIAMYLREKGVEEGDRVLLLYPPGLDYLFAFFGCLYAKVIAVPAYPPDPLRLQKTLPRLQAILKDSQAKIILSNNKICKFLQGIDKIEHWQKMPVFGKIAKKIIPQDVKNFTNIPCVSTEGLQTSGEGWQCPKVDLDTLAFLQYTSGSTGTPRGVMLTHGNILYNQQMIRDSSHVQTQMKTVVSWLPFYHDMGLIGMILHPFYCGARAILMSPISFLKNPFCWLQAISHYQADTSGGPNFCYDLCSRKITDQQIQSLDLSSWKLTFNGAEPIRSTTIERFCSRFAACGFTPQTFFPCYGLAEATLIVSGLKSQEISQVCVVDKLKLRDHQLQEVPSHSACATELVSCGSTILEQQIIIVNPHTRVRCQEQQIGEIWVCGKNVAQGYWQNSQQTAETFQGYTVKNEGPFLRTGDLGFIKDGELFVTGRIKDLIIIDGKNYYPTDIGKSVEDSHEALRPGCATAFSIDIEDQERLVIVAEVSSKKVNCQEIIHAICQEITQSYELETYAIALIAPRTMPKTSSGKIQCYACKQNFLQGNLKVITQWDKSAEVSSSKVHDNDAQNITMPRNKTEKWLQECIASELEILPKLLCIDKNFVDYGMDSRKSIVMVGEIERYFDCSLNLEILREYPSVKLLADYLCTQYGDNKNNEVPLSAIPESFYNVQKFHEVQKLRNHKQIFGELNIPSPYFCITQTTTNDTVKIDNREVISFSSYNYLGLSGHPEVNKAACDAILQYGTSTSASRIVTGEKPIHQQLEKSLASLLGTEDCIVLVSGHATNVTVIGHLFSVRDLIVYDSLSHNSIIQGIQLSGAKHIVFNHNDCEHLQKILQHNRGKYEKVIIIAEGVYSMDGDIAPLPELIEIKKKYKTLLMIDEAHSVGVIGKTGRGIGEYYDVNAQDVDLWMGTLSKSFASCGGYIAGSYDVVDYLKYTAPGFMYSVGIPAANAAATQTAIEVMLKEPQRVKRLQENARLFLHAAKSFCLNTGPSENTAIIPVITGNSQKALHLSHQLLQKGISVHPILAPAVQENEARLRFFITSEHTSEQIHYTLEQIVAIYKADA